MKAVYYHEVLMHLFSVGRPLTPHSLAILRSFKCCAPDISDDEVLVKGTSAPISILNMTHRILIPVLWPQFLVVVRGHLRSLRSNSDAGSRVCGRFAYPPRRIHRRLPCESTSRALPARLSLDDLRSLAVGSRSRSGGSNCTAGKNVKDFVVGDRCVAIRRLS